MRRIEVSSSKPGGECGVAVATLRSHEAGGGTTEEACCAGITAGAATPTGSALTKCFRTLVVHFWVTGARRLQQLWASCLASESSNCGQEKQFPQNRAATTSRDSSELENALKAVEYHSGDSDNKALIVYNSIQPLVEAERAECDYADAIDRQ